MITLLDSQSSNYLFKFGVLIPEIVISSNILTFDRFKQRSVRISANTLFELTESKTWYIIKISLLGFGIFLHIQIKN